MTRSGTPPALTSRSDAIAIPHPFTRTVAPASVGAVVAGFGAASVVVMVVESINGRVFYPGLATATEGVAANPMLPPPLLFWVASLVVLWPSAYLGSGSAHSR